MEAANSCFSLLSRRRRDRRPQKHSPQFPLRACLHRPPANHICSSARLLISPAKRGAATRSKSLSRFCPLALTTAFRPVNESPLLLVLLNSGAISQPDDAGRHGRGIRLCHSDRLSYLPTPRSFLILPAVCTKDRPRISNYCSQHIPPLRLRPRKSKVDEANGNRQHLPVSY